MYKDVEWGVDALKMWEVEEEAYKIVSGGRRSNKSRRPGGGGNTSLGGKMRGQINLAGGKAESL